MGIEGTIDEYKDFVGRHILSGDMSLLTVSEGRALLKKKKKYILSSCSPFKHKVDNVCELEYWGEIIKFIIHRIENKNTKQSHNFCTSYSTIKYLKSGLPITIYPTMGMTIIRNITLTLLFASGILQLVRAQIDGGLSFWSQILYAAGCLVSIVYYIHVDNIEFIVPQVGSLAISVLSILGILQHQSESVVKV